MDDLGPPNASPKERPLWQKLAWMAAIWAASISVLGVVAYIIRFWLNG